MKRLAIAASAALLGSSLIACQSKEPVYEDRQPVAGEIQDQPELSTGQGQAGADEEMMNRIRDLETQVMQLQSEVNRMQTQPQMQPQPQPQPGDMGQPGQLQQPGTQPPQPMQQPGMEQPSVPGQPGYPDQPVPGSEVSPGTPGEPQGEEFPPDMVEPGQQPIEPQGVEPQLQEQGSEIPMDDEGTLN